MDILHFSDRNAGSRLESLEKLPDSGTVWINFHRDSDPDWPDTVKQLTGVSIDERHLKDAGNDAHPSFTDSTDDYEMVIFRSLSPSATGDQFSTRPTAFFLIDRVLVTVSPSDSRSIEATSKRLIQGKVRFTVHPAAIMFLVTNNMVDRFLLMREALIAQLNEYRDALLDPRNPFDDWRALLSYQKQVLTLEVLSDSQGDAITLWRDNTDTEIDDYLSVRLTDLLEHIRRVSEFSASQQREIDSLVQLHFSAVAHRTNEIVRVLTLISAIFLPLTLIAGIFGMNFVNMPELKTQYGYFFALGGMFTLAVGLLIYFRIKRWF
jgi:magnesium transporter